MPEDTAKQGAASLTVEMGIFVTSNQFTVVFFLPHPPPLTASADTEEGKALYILILLLVLEPGCCCFLVPGMFLAWAF